MGERYTFVGFQEAVEFMGASRWKCSSRLLFCNGGYSDFSQVVLCSFRSLRGPNSGLFGASCSDPRNFTSPAACCILGLQTWDSSGVTKRGETDVHAPHYYRCDSNLAEPLGLFHWPSPETKKPAISNEGDKPGYDEKRF